MKHGLLFEGIGGSDWFQMSLSIKMVFEKDESLLKKISGAMVWNDLPCLFLLLGYCV